MTDRVAYLVVGLERDIREDDLEPLVAAVRMLKGVLVVRPGEDGHEHAVWLAEERVRREMQARVWDAVTGRK